MVHREGADVHRMPRVGECVTPQGAAGFCATPSEPDQKRRYPQAPGDVAAGRSF